VSRARAAYASLWRRLPVPRSARTLPVLPPLPLSRAYGADRGRPVDRIYIERWLARHAADVRGRRVLEVAEDTYARRLGAAAVDVLAPEAGDGVTVVGDLAAGIPGAWDCLICTQTFDLIYDVPAAVAGAAALLAPGGVLLASFPGISQHTEAERGAYPHLWRFTALAVRRLLEAEFAAVEVQAFGTVASSAAFLYGLGEDELGDVALDPHDPDYEMVICARAARPTGPLV
jgi:hypothetical protein